MYYRACLRYRSEQALSIRRPSEKDRVAYAATKAPTYKGVLRMSKSVKLTTSTQEALELPVLEASIGHDVVDIRTLTKNTGLFSFDPGFVSTASCELLR